MLIHKTIVIINIHIIIKIMVLCFCIKVSIAYFLKDETPYSRGQRAVLERYLPELGEDVAAEWKALLTDKSPGFSEETK